MKIKLPKSIQLARVPTPIEKLGRLSSELDGPEIFIKRDDLTGMELTGNKIRKLEFVVADALEKGADTLITCGGIQSNHARATAMVAARLAMKAFLVLRGQEAKYPDGNLLLDRLLGAEVKFISQEEYENVDAVMGEIAEELKTQGRRPYIIPLGASNEIGAWGYLKATAELKKQLKEMRVKIDHIITPLGSGGTQAGLILGRKIYGLQAQIHGINVCDSEQYFINCINGILQAFQEKYSLNLNLTKNDISVIDGYVGKGYALSREEEVELIKWVAKIEGIILDPVYTGKVMFGLVDQIKEGRFKKGESILFLHTGGIFGLFPKRAFFFGGEDVSEFSHSKI